MIIGMHHHALFYVGLKMEHRAWGNMETEEWEVVMGRKHLLTLSQPPLLPM